jgi:hypothetical protein
MIRLGRSVASGIMETAREQSTDLMLLGWPGHTTRPDAAFGSVIDLVPIQPGVD